jgi:hypothetical protein
MAYAGSSRWPTLRQVTPPWFDPSDGRREPHLPVDPDHNLRLAAVDRARRLARDFDDLVPLPRLREGFVYAGERLSFGSFQKGIHRSRRQKGPAALTLMTSLRDPYGDEVAHGEGFVYGYRSGPLDQPDNRALRAAYEHQVAVVYFRAIGPGLYWTKCADVRWCQTTPQGRPSCCSPGFLSKT